MSERRSHIGVRAFLAERDALLAEFDKAKKHASDDAVKTEHGNVGEAVIREWLARFLPRKFAVTKGYIITSDPAYEGPLEEWDIIIYDQLESPVLFVRDSPDFAHGGVRRAIPIEHVRGVVEVKATFRPDMARKVCAKLRKLAPFFGREDAPDYPKFIKQPFASSVIFFESAIKNYADFRAAVNELTPLASHPESCPHSLLILRSQTNPEHCACLRWLASDASLEGLCCDPDLSNEFSWPDGKSGLLGVLGGWCVNDFPMYLFDFLRELSGTRRIGFMSSTYGLDLENVKGSRLFPWPPTT